MNSQLIWAVAGALIFGSTTLALAKEWWHDTFIQDGSGTCEDNDSLRTYSASEIYGWETSCKITKTQRINGIENAVVLDLVCGGTDMTPETYKSRELLVKDQDGIRVYPEGIKFQTCSLAKVKKAVQQETAQTICPISLSVLRSDPRDDGTYQLLEFKDGFLDAQATLTGYKNDEPIWTTKAHATCSNGALICRMTFKTRAGEDYQEAYQPLTVADQPWVVFAELRQTLFLKERNPAYERKAYGGIEVNFLNGYEPTIDEMILPENVYKFSRCSAAEGATDNQ